MLTVGAAVLVASASACGPAELEVSDPPPTHPEGVVIVRSPTRDLTIGSTLVEDPAVTTIPESSTTTESTTTTVASTTVPPTTAAPPPSPPTTDLPPTSAEGSVAFVNQKRSENGRPALTVDPQLEALAEAWAQQIASDGNLRHNPQLGDQIPAGYRAWGENVGYAGAPEAIDNGWWNSEGHRNNMLSSNYESIGVAFVRDSSGTYWGVQVFAGR